MKECNNTGIQTVSELPIDNLESVPDYFLTVRAVVDNTTGDVTECFTRTPGAKVLPSGNMDNVFGLLANNEDFTIPENQVVPAYVSSNVTFNSVVPADGNNKAVFLVVGSYGEQLLCQNCGVVNIMGGHQYIVGAQYYLATDGGVTTDASQTGQKLFIPVSNQKLALNMSF